MTSGALRRISRFYRPVSDLFRGIGRRLVVRVLMFSSAVTLILTASQLYRDYSYDVGIINARLDEIGHSYLDSISQSLWSLDENQLNLQLHGILRLPNIQAVEVREITNGDRPIEIKVGNQASTAVVAREFSIVHALGDEVQPIGRLYVEATLTEIYRSLLDKALFILAGQGAKTFLVTFFVVYIFHRLVTRHLARIASFVADYSIGRPIRRLTLDRTPPDQPDELDQVVASFNAMVEGLQTSYEQLRDANVQLERDNAALSEAQAAQQESEQQFRDYAETASDWFWQTGPDHSFTYISENSVAFAIDGSSRIGHRRWEMAVDVESEPRKWREHRATLERHEPFRDFVYKTYGKDGSLRYCSISGKPLFAEDGRFLGYRGTSTDVTARSAAEARVRELSVAVEQSPAGIAIVSASGHLVYSNKVFLQIIGLARFDHQVAVTSVLPCEVWERLCASVRCGEVGREEVFAKRLSQEPFWGLVSVAGIHSSDNDDHRLVIALEDVTREKAQQEEREALQRRLQQAGKMEAIGRLAGGIAHDFNNLLGATMGFSEFLVDDLPEGSKLHRYAERIARISDRGKDLVDQLLAFAGARETEQRVLDLATVTHGCRDLLETSLPSSSTLVIEAGDSPIPVRCNEGQLHQILLNLCLNAKDALRGSPGTITVRLSQLRPDHMTCSKVERFGSGELKPGCDYALIAVSDTGSGMDAATRARIFEPFYTTKMLGRGTGLGLAVVHGIVTSSDGAICVESAAGAGTTFEIYLPLADAPLTPTVDDTTRQQKVRGHEHILVVDDNADLAQTLTIGLHRYGYEVMSTTDPANALRIFSEHPERWDLVVSDQVMPGMTGMTLIAKLKEQRPELRTILYTGFDLDVPAGSTSLQGIDAILHKPVRPLELATQIRRILDARPRVSLPSLPPVAGSE
jgi:PAS domain S-box-containing protein